MKTRLALTAAAAALLMSLPAAAQGTWQSALQPRDLNADGTVDAWYDTTRDLSWAADADPIGANDWATTAAWVQGLDLHGVTGWRLPTMQAAAGGFPVCPDYTYDGSGDCGFNVDPERSELAHMYQVLLGNRPIYDTGGVYHLVSYDPVTGAYVPAPGWGLTETGPFVNLRAGDYPTGLTEPCNLPGQPLCVWLFETGWGYQDGGIAGDPTFHAWAVHDGDVMAAVPEPGSGALLAAGGALLARLVRRRRR